MRSAILLLFAAVFALSHAQEPKRCVSPTQWEGRILQVDREKAFERQGKFSYDAVNQRTRFIEEVEESQERDFYDELFIFKTKRGYKLNLKTKSCDNFSLTEPFEPIEIPPNATLYGEYYLGTSAMDHAGILVQSFGGDTRRGRYVGSFTAVGCVPVYEVYFSTATGVVVTDFYDVTLGISDPNVFVPPPECQHPGKK